MNIFFVTFFYVIYSMIMEIISKLVEIEAELPVDNVYIEQKLKEMGIDPLRWAIVGVNGHILTISLACENL